MALYTIKHRTYGGEAGGQQVLGQPVLYSKASSRKKKNGGLNKRNHRKEKLNTNEKEKEKTHCVYVCVHTYVCMLCMGEGGDCCTVSSFSMKNL